MEIQGFCPINTHEFTWTISLMKAKEMLSADKFSVLKKKECFTHYLIYFVIFIFSFNISF